MKYYIRVIIVFAAVFCSSSLYAALISVTASISDRGRDSNNDGIYTSVFGNPSVVQISISPSGTLGLQEATAVEFPLASIPLGSTIDSVLLRLAPQSSITSNLGISATETATIHGYSGDGVISVADLNVNNLVGTIPGPTPDGFVTTIIDTMFIQSLVDATATHAGLLFNAVQTATTSTFYSFRSAYSGAPQELRPHLLIEISDSNEVPEPVTLSLLGVGLAVFGFMRRRKQTVSLR